MSDLFTIQKPPEIKSAYSDDARVVIYSGDCLDAIKQLPSESMHLIITSPPYNVGKAYERSTKLNEYLGALEPN